MDYIAQFFANFPVVASIYWFVAWIGGVLDLFLFVIFVIAFAHLIQYRPRVVRSPQHWQRYVRKKKEPTLNTPVVGAAWSKVQSKMKDASPDSLRLAVIEADGITDEVLKRMGLGGETFADRLGHLPPARYRSTEKLWDAHRLRNNLVHTPDFNVPEAAAEDAIANYEAFLKEVKAL